MPLDSGAGRLGTSPCRPSRTADAATSPAGSIQAISNAGAKSVKFVSAEAGVSRIEGSAPWAFLGNNGNAYTPWTPVVKPYTITASGYSAGAASGTAGKPLTININVVP